ncbi:Uncharacterised protein [Vibrio cholerae]|nr:Uncharacterised protein [Vibrio cholerae]CSI51467.1 Uncharacterised protein [Vibrio cholerae]
MISAILFRPSRLLQDRRQCCYLKDDPQQTEAVPKAHRQTWLTNS